jgi:hypothetical protein
MSTHCLEPLTEDEMYAIEFHDCELHEDEPEEEAENGCHCPVCHATELQYAMHYRVSDDDETQELYRCARCGATGEADDCRVETIARRKKRACIRVRLRNDEPLLSFSVPHCFAYFFLPHRAAAALRAISWRRSLVRARARALPPTKPAFLPITESSSGDRFSARALPPFRPPSRPRATACGFFVAIQYYYKITRKCPKSARTPAFYA